MQQRVMCVAVCLWLAVAVCFASIFGTVRGIAHDPQHRPIPETHVSLKALASDWVRSTTTDSDGEFGFTGVPAGQYQVTVSHQAFTTLTQKIEVRSGSAPILHFALKLASMSQTVEVSAAPEWINPDSPGTETVVSREEIAKTPGADRTNSLAMITSFVPGAYLVHDQLHIRGGHQVSWLVDGVSVPNTNIAGNVGPQFDPKDVDYLEIRRGGYSAEFGDRMFGVFNVVPRSGFERNNEAELAASYGSFHEANTHFSLGSHTQRFAYYASISGNRTDLGLQTPSAEPLHALSDNLGGFASLIYNPDARNQVRLVGSLRGDHYQVPNTPEQQDLGIRDIQRERDAFLNFSWARVLAPGSLLTVSPFYHRNRAAFDGGSGDKPFIATDDRISSYIGGEVSLSIVKGKHNLRTGVTALEQKDDSALSLRSADGEVPPVEQSEKVWGNLQAAYAEEQYKITTWLTLNGGLRLTHFAGRLTENAASPRAGAALRIPRLNWVVRGFYGRYYQPPPLNAISGPLLDLALQEGFDFLPLPGERDIQREIGLAIPFKGWAFDLSRFHTNARNFFDHTPLGNANIFFPLTIEAARIRGTEATVRSPLLLHRVLLHLAYSRQYVQGRGRITGGLTDFSPPESGYFYLDHDQRDTLTAGFEANLPWQAWIAGNTAIGSGFLDGDGPDHLPMHTTFDIACGRSFGERLSLRLNMLNLTNHRYLLDNSNTFGGTHFNYPRQISVTLRFRFHY